MRISMYVVCLTQTKSMKKRRSKFTNILNTLAVFKIVWFFIIICLSLKATNTVEEKHLPSATRTFRMNFIK